MAIDDQLPDWEPDPRFIEFLGTLPVNPVAEGYARMVLRNIELRTVKGKQLYDASLRRLEAEFRQYLLETAGIGPS